MIDISDFDDIFDRMNRLFGGYSDTDGFIDNQESERIVDEDKIYYTFSIREEVNKDQIEVVPYIDRLEIFFKTEEAEAKYVAKTPYPIIPDKTEVKFNNNILDIVVYIQENEGAKIEVSS